MWEMASSPRSSLSSLSTLHHSSNPQHQALPTLPPPTNLLHHLSQEHLPSPSTHPPLLHQAPLGSANRHRKTKSQLSPSNANATPSQLASTAKSDSIASQSSRRHWLL